MTKEAILVNRKVVTRDSLDIKEWGEFMSDINNRRVVETYLNEEGDICHGTGSIRVSTVFLGMDHNWSNRGSAKWFETMVFWSIPGEDHDDFMDRYETWEEAEMGHAKIVEEVIDLLKKKSKI